MTESLVSTRTAAAGAVGTRQGRTKIGVAHAGVLDVNENLSRLEVLLLDNGVVLDDAEGAVVLVEDLCEARSERSSKGLCEREGKLTMAVWTRGTLGADILYLWGLLL